MLNVEAFLGYVKSQKYYENQIVYIEEIPSKPPEYGVLDIPVHNSLMKWLIDKKYKLWSHQAKAINNILKGKNVIIATSTSSGKSLCYNLPMLSSILEDKESTALYIFPRKALTQDQNTELLKMFEEMNVEKDLVGIYDGDTSADLKRYIRANSNVIMTNPYALHKYLPFFQRLWSRICKNLKYVVIDEVHLYKGIFGTNVALLLRRLKRILKIFNVNPQWILCSATINDPKGFAERLVGEQFTLVNKDGSPSGIKKVVLWNLPYNDLENKYYSGNTQAQNLFISHLEKGIQTILFTKSRKWAELQATWAKGELTELYNKIGIYRAGLSTRDRRGIEQGLKSKKLLGVCSTNALELGIDIGSLEATITSGFPRTISSFRQQIGRSGRGEDISISTLIPKANPLDFFYIHNPDVLFGPIQEKLLINLRNKQVLKQQIRCAAREISINTTEYKAFGIENKQLFLECLEELAKGNSEGKKYLERKGNNYYSIEKAPTQIVNIDNLSEYRYSVYIISETDVKPIYLTTDDEEHVYRDIHPGAIFLYNTRQYYVEQVDFEKREIFVRRVKRNFYTVSLYDNIIKRLKVQSQKHFKTNPIQEIFYGKVNVKQEYHSYVKIENKSQEVIATEELSVPILEFDTEAVWLLIPKEFEKQISDRGLNFEGSLHGLLHGLIHTIPILAQIDLYDIDGTYYLDESEYKKPTIYIFDAYKGGIGIAERVYEKFNKLLFMTYNLLKKCHCTSRTGCPGCIIASNCVHLNEPLDKKGTQMLLELLLDEKLEFKSIKPLETRNDEINNTQDIESKISEKKISSNIEDIQKYSKNLNLDLNISEKFIKAIREFHYKEGITYSEIKDELNLPRSESMNMLFLRILGYSSWDAYHTNRAKMKVKNKNQYKKDVFSLKLESNKWYVGKTTNLKNAVRRHKNGNGSAWTKKHKVISLQEVFKNGDLKQITLDYMRKYGWENVRGYAWSQTNMKYPPKALRNKK